MQSSIIITNMIQSELSLNCPSELFRCMRLQSGHTSLQMCNKTR